MTSPALLFERVEVQLAPIILLTSSTGASAPGKVPASSVVTPSQHCCHMAEAPLAYTVLSTSSILALGI